MAKSINRININDITKSIKIVKLSDLTLKIRSSMIELFKKCEPDIIANNPQFFTKSGKFLGFNDDAYPKNTYIILIYARNSSKLINSANIKYKTKKRIIKRGNKSQKVISDKLIGFMVLNDLMDGDRYFFHQFKKIMAKQKGNNGLYFNWVCGNNKYKGIFLSLINYFIEYYKNPKNELYTELSKYKYILGIVENERIYKDKLLYLYKKGGFMDIGVHSIYEKNDYHVIVYLLR